MKKLLLIALVSIFTLSTYAQNTKVQSAYAFLNDYLRTQNAETLLKAKEAIDLAADNASTKVKGKTWFYRGNIYMKMAENPDLLKQQPDAPMIAMQSFKQALDVKDPKFKKKDDVVRNISYITGNLLYNPAIQAYQNKEYDKAYKGFLGAKEGTEYLTKIGKPFEQIKAEDCIANAANAASLAGNKEAAMKIYEDIIAEGNADANTYGLLSGMYDEAGMSDKSAAVLAEGIKKYPDNMNLLLTEINVYLKNDKAVEAIDKLKKGIELDPKNHQLLYILGNAYDKSGDIENAKATYLKAIEVKPDYADAFYNLGAMYNNQAKEVSEKISNLGFSAEDQKKETVLKAERNEYFKSSKKYFEQLLAITPDDENVKKIVTKIDSYIE